MDTQCTFLQHYYSIIIKYLHGIEQLYCRPTTSVLFYNLKKKISQNGGGGMPQLPHSPISANGVT